MPFFLKIRERGSHSAKLRRNSSMIATPVLHRAMLKSALHAGPGLRATRPKSRGRPGQEMKQSVICR
jgi:hypothetical protein